MRHGFLRFLLASIIFTAIGVVAWQIHPNADSAGSAGLLTSPTSKPLAESRPQTEPETRLPNFRIHNDTNLPPIAVGPNPPPLPPPPPVKLSTGDDKQILQNAGIAIDGPALLDFFRSRTLTSDERENIQAMVRRLGDKSFPVRRKMSAELSTRGAKAVPLLFAAVQDPDPELRRRADECLKEISLKDHAPAVLAAAARLVGREKPADAAAVLLAFLPYSTSISVSEEIRNALAACALRESKPEVALVSALETGEPVQRGAAAEALCRAGALTELPKVRKLLQDTDRSVRLQAALALATVQDKEAIPVLIELLDLLPVAQAWQAEDLLCRLADGQMPPNVPLGRDAAGQTKCREAWEAWWKQHGEKADLARLAGRPRLLGYTMVVLLEAGKIQEVAADGKLLWSIDGLQWPLDAQLLPGDRVLVAEGQGNRVTERNFKGDILWEHALDNPLVAQRLPNGNTFMANMSQVLEVDRTGKEIFSHAVDGAPIRKAAKLPNGDFACVLSNRKLVRFDANGKELSSFTAIMQHYGGRLEVLPNGHVLIPQFHTNKVVEYDAEGKSVWEASADHAIAAVRLANGNTLVTFMNETRAVELDREGKEVWEYKSDTRLTRAWRR